MSLVHESSVSFSVQQLLDEETARLESAAKERAAQRARELELQEQARNDELTQIEQRAQQVKVERQRAESRLAASLLKARIAAENEATLARRDSERQREQQLMALRHDTRVCQLLGKQRILSAMLGTMVAGSVTCWFLVVAPGQRRANLAYAELRQAYDSKVIAARQREADLLRQQRQLADRLDSLLLSTSSVSNQVTPIETLPQTKPRPNHQSTLATPSCTCLPTDPLCDCANAVLLR